MNRSGIESFDHVVVGTGQATATLIAGLPEGESVAVIEGGSIGGSCVNVGCTPTKALVASAKVAHLARRARDYGVDTGEVTVDHAAVMKRMNRIRHASRDGLSAFLSRSPAVTVVRGWGRFESPKVLRVGERRIRGGRIYLNVGARPRTPDIPGLEQVPWLDNARLLELDRRPDHLIAVGGSYVGLEFAQMFARFGSQVTVIERGPQLMFREDADVAAAAREILKADGIDVHLHAKRLRVAPGPNGGVELVVESHGDTTSVRGSHLLIAAGRVPNTDGLGLENAGIACDERGHVVVDDQLRTSVPGIFALGDVNGRGAFTHTSVNDAEIVLDAMRGGSRRLSQRIPVYAMFIDPPLGRVGMTENEAVATGRSVLKATRPMRAIARAKEMGETEGFVEVLVDGDDDRILGASVLGVGGDEIINLFAAVMHAETPWREFRSNVFVHPTVSELMPWILDGLQPVQEPSVATVA